MDGLVSDGLEAFELSSRVFRDCLPLAQNVQDPIPVLEPGVFLVNLFVSRVAAMILPHACDHIINGALSQAAGTYGRGIVMAAYISVGNLHQQLVMVEHDTNARGFELKVSGESGLEIHVAVVAGYMVSGGLN